MFVVPSMPGPAKCFGYWRASALLPLGVSIRCAFAFPGALTATVFVVPAAAVANGSPARTASAAAAATQVFSRYIPYLRWSLPEDSLQEVGRSPPETLHEPTTRPGTCQPAGPGLRVSEGSQR